MSQERLLEMLPEHFAMLKEMIEIARIEGKKFDRLDDDVKDLLDQMYIHTATWGLTYWEKRYMLPELGNDEDYEKRRRRILSKKRSNKADLVDIAKAIEPNLSLSWGGLTLPFYIEHETDKYDFGELIVALEEEKPSHLTYSFSLIPNGYTVKAFRNDRYSVDLRLISGTANAGRWPQASTRGESLHNVININGKEVTGVSEPPRSAGLSSGNDNDQNAFGSVDENVTLIKGYNITGESSFNRSGDLTTGTVLTESFGHTDETEANCIVSTKTGDSYFPCGSRSSGEGVA